MTDHDWQTLTSIVPIKYKPLKLPRGEKHMRAKITVRKFLGKPYCILPLLREKKEKYYRDLIDYMKKEIESAD